MNHITFLADPSAIRLQKIVSALHSITLVVRTTRLKAFCPVCHTASARVHSRYVRHVADLPWQGTSVRLELHTRRYRCINDLCRRSVFCERLPSVVAHYARRSARLSETLALISLALGGRAASRLTNELAMAASRDTLLRGLRRLPPVVTATPRVLGIDDWSKRKGKTYGTILVDLEKRRPIDLLPDREAETVAAWLRDHPGVEIVSRDRAPAYADGTRQGAPKAVQVADRWHLLRNMTEALERWLGRKRRCLRQAASEIVASEAKNTDFPVEEVTTKAQTWRTQKQLRREERRAGRLVLFNEIRELHQQGASIHGLARKFNVHRRVVRLFLRADEYPERAAPKRKPSILDQHLPYLWQRWEEGCHNATELTREIRERGFCGAESLVRHYITPWRAALPAYSRCTRRLQSGPPPKRMKTPSPRAAAWLLVNQEEKLTEEQRTIVSKLVEGYPEMKTAQSLAQRFQQMISERRAEEFDAWVTEAAQSQLPEVANFAIGLKRDPAVRAALTLPWSNGQVEGQVNKLKMLKRQMFGRANFDLLRIRVLQAQ